MINTTNIDDSTILRAMFSSAGEGLVVVDEQGVICMTNPRITEMFGYLESELIGQKIEMLIPRGRRKEHVQDRESYIHNPNKRSMGVGMDLSGERKDGTAFPIEVSLNYFINEERTYVMAMVTDITIRKNAERELQELNVTLESLVDERTKALKESQNLYSAIARNFPKGTINVFDKELNYVFVEGEDLYKAGITSKRLVGTNYIRHLPSEIREFIRAELQEVFEGKSKSLEVTIPKGTYLLNCAPLPDLEGEIRQILLVEQNITRQKQAEQEAMAALQKEKELSELKSRFVSMASHEFRTPLSTILSSANLIAKYEGDAQAEKRLKHVHRIQSNVKSLTAILNDFLSISKLEEGRIQPKPEPVSMREFLFALIEEMQEIAKEGQQILLQCDSNPQVYVDQEHLKNIFFNLVSNAIKYSPEHKEITLSCEDIQDEWHISVTDQGIGIPEAEKPRMFERFFRAKNATNIQGTGLGLNIVKRYAELMNGRIAFESAEGKGSTFTLILPKMSSR